MPVAIKAGPDYRTIQHIERRKQRRGPMPKIVMSHRSASGLFSLEARAEFDPMLESGFFVHA